MAFFFSFKMLKRTQLIMQEAAKININKEYEQHQDIANNGIIILSPDCSLIPSELDITNKSNVIDENTPIILQGEVQDFDVIQLEQQEFHPILQLTEDQSNVVPLQLEPIPEMLFPENNLSLSYNSIESNIMNDIINSIPDFAPKPGNSIDPENKNYPDERRDAYSDKDYTNGGDSYHDKNNPCNGDEPSCSYDSHNVGSPNDEDDPDFIIENEVSSGESDDNFPANEINIEDLVERGIRKRKRQPENYKNNKIKHLRNTGKQYVNSVGNIVPNRAVKQIDCTKCKMKCTENLSDEERKLLHENYWSLPVTRRRKTSSENSKRQFTYIYHFSKKRNFGKCKSLEELFF